MPVMNDDALKALERARLMQFSNDCEKLGVECADDFQLVQRRELARMKMNHIQKRRFLVAFSAAEEAVDNPVDGASNKTIAAAGLSCTRKSGSTTIPAAIATGDTRSGAAAQASVRPVQQLDVLASEFQDCSSGCSGDVYEPPMPLAAAVSAASDNSPEAGDLPSIMTVSVNDGESGPTADDFPALAATKTRGLKRRCREASTQYPGAGRLKTFRVHENGTRVSQNQDGSTAVGGIGRAVSQANRSGCECLLRLQDAEKHKSPAGI
jgi:hypothetical protein